MKKNIKILVLTLMIILTSTLTLTVNASEATVTLNPSEAQLNPGDTFIVTLNATHEEGINGIEATLSYDKDKLELNNINIVNTLNWSLLNETVEEGLNLAIVNNSTSEIKNADILKIEFKVKETAGVGTIAKISLKDITIDGDTANSTKQIGTKEIQLSIVEKTENPGQTPGEGDGENPGQNPGGNDGQNPGNNPSENPQEKTLKSIEVKSDATKLEYNIGEKFEKSGLVVKAIYSDGTSKEITDYTITNGDKLEKGQTSVTISYTEKGVTKTTSQAIKVVEKTVSNDKKDDGKSEYKEIKDDGTKKEEQMPDTGVSSIVGIMVVVAVFGVMCLIKYNKYKEI